MSMIEPIIKVDKILFEQIKFGVRKVLSNSQFLFMKDAYLETYVDYLVDDLVLNLTASVQSQKMFEENIVVELQIEFKKPASWWQHFKQDIFPKWMQKKFPVRYEIVVEKRNKTICLKGYKTFPYSSYQVPKEFGQFFVYEKIDEHPWKE